VQIVYDAARPQDAQLAHGSDIGPVGGVFFAALALGAGLVVVGLLRLRRIRKADRLPVGA